MVGSPECVNRTLRVRLFEWYYQKGKPSIFTAPGAKSGFD